MDLGARRTHRPVWPPRRQAAYHNLSSTEELNLPEMPNSAQSSHRLLAGQSPSPTPYTPALDSSSSLKFRSTPITLYSIAETSNSSWRKPTWLGEGWRKGARIAFFGTAVILLTNLILLLYLTLGFERMDGFPVIYRGTCEQVEEQNSIWHFFINILSTGALGASNYCMHLLSAPTRTNIDEAHSTGHWLDIGIPSLRNLRFLSWKRRTLYWILAISSIPLHLIYNSVFYAAIANVDYNILYAAPSFTTGSPYDKRAFPDSAGQEFSSFQAAAKDWTALSNPDCIKAYANDFVTQYQNVIALVNTSALTPAQSQTFGNSSLLDVSIYDLPKNDYLGGTFDNFAWICNDTMTSNKTDVWTKNKAGFVPCSAMVAKLEQISNQWWKTGGFHVTSCLAQPIEPQCHLHFAPQFMGIVAVMNIAKLLVIFYVAFRMLDKPMVTLGDAIESFIVDPEPVTSGMCLLSAAQVEHTWYRRAFHRPDHLYTNPSPQPQSFQRHSRRWAYIGSRSQWLLLACIFLFTLITILISLHFGVSNLAPPTFSNAWSLGLGNVRTQNLVVGLNLLPLGASAVLVTALIANAPQLLFPFSYLIYNTFFTLAYLGEEWDLFGAYTPLNRHAWLSRDKKSGRRSGQQHKYLRVSAPQGRQKSTHFLALPFRYALVLSILSGLFHFLMSQTLYLANIAVIPRDGTLPRQDEITTVAYSPQGMVWLAVLTIVTILVLAANMLRKFGGEMTLVGSNSIAISAACHVDARLDRAEREAMVLGRIAWGELPGELSLSHKDSAASTPSLGAGGFDKRYSNLSSPYAGLGLGLETQGTKDSDKDRKSVRYSQTDFAKEYHETADTEYTHGPAEEVQLHDANTSDGRDEGRSSGIAHCGFSSGRLKRLEEGKLYA